MGWTYYCSMKRSQDITRPCVVHIQTNMMNEVNEVQDQRVSTKLWIQICKGRTSQRVCLGFPMFLLPSVEIHILALVTSHVAPVWWASPQHPSASEKPGSKWPETTLQDFLDLLKPNWNLLKTIICSQLLFRPWGRINTICRYLHFDFLDLSMHFYIFLHPSIITTSIYETFDTRILTEGRFSGAKARLCRCGKWPQSPAVFFLIFAYPVGDVVILQSKWSMLIWLFRVKVTRVRSTLIANIKQLLDLRLTSDSFSLQHTSTRFEYDKYSMTCWTQILKLVHDFIGEGALKAAAPGGRRSFSFCASRASSRHLPSMTIPSNMRFLGASTTATTTTTARFFGPKRTCSSVSS